MANNNKDYEHFEAIRKTQTADSVVLPRDVFEKLYLSPHMQPKADKLRKTFGNPTPISLIGFLISSTALAMTTMGWRGAGGNGGAILPAFIFFGGMVQCLGAIGEWIIGNTFPCAVFITYGTFWIVYGTTLMPFFAAGAAYSSTGNALEGQQTPSFHATTATYYICMTIITLFFLVCSIRTNICLFATILLLVVDFSLFVGINFELALGHTAKVEQLQLVAGALLFVISLIVWYLLLAELLEAVDFPIAIPVGDLSTRVPGRRQRLRAKETHEV